MIGAVIGTQRWTEEEMAMFKRIGDFYFWAVRLSFVSGISATACADTIRNETKHGDYERTAKRLIKVAEKAAWKARRRSNADQNPKSG